MRVAWWPLRRSRRGGRCSGGAVCWARCCLGGLPGSAPVHACALCRSGWSAVKRPRPERANAVPAPRCLYIAVCRLLSVFGVVASPIVVAISNTVSGPFGVAQCFAGAPHQATAAGSPPAQGVARFLCARQVAGAFERSDLGLKACDLRFCLREVFAFLPSLNASQRSRCSGVIACPCLRCRSSGRRFCVHRSDPQDRVVFSVPVSGPSAAAWFLIAWALGLVYRLGRRLASCAAVRATASIRSRTSSYRRSGSSFHFAITSRWGCRVVASLTLRSSARVYICADGSIFAWPEALHLDCQHPGGGEPDGSAQAEATLVRGGVVEDGRFGRVRELHEVAFVVDAPLALGPPALFGVEGLAHASCDVCALACADVHRVVPCAVARAGSLSAPLFRERCAASGLVVRRASPASSIVGLACLQPGARRCAYALPMALRAQRVLPWLGALVVSAAASAAVACPATLSPWVYAQALDVRSGGALVVLVSVRYSTPGHVLQVVRRDVAGRVLAFDEVELRAPPAQALPVGGVPVHDWSSVLAEMPAAPFVPVPRSRRLFDRVAHGQPVPALTARGVGSLVDGVWRHGGPCRADCAAAPAAASVRAYIDSLVALAPPAPVARSQRWLMAEPLAGARRLEADVGAEPALLSRAVVRARALALERPYALVPLVDPAQRFGWPGSALVLGSHVGPVAWWVLVPARSFVAGVREPVAVRSAVRCR